MLIDTHTEFLDNELRVYWMPRTVRIFNYVNIEIGAVFPNKVENGQLSEAW